MYAGIASGSNNAQSNIRRPGNSQVALIQPTAAPITTTPIATPQLKSSVSNSAAGMTVAAR